jgi:ribose 5-phosphate isomerase A
MPTQDELKQQVARRAVQFVENGMRLGLGTGSTAKLFVDELAIRVRDGLKVVGVPTSLATEAQARALGIPLSTLDETPELDLTIDGADEMDAALNLIKGGGAALLREKIVAAASHKMLVIADFSKQVKQLGRFPLPIEVNKFGLGATRLAVQKALSNCGIACDIVLRKTKEGHDLVTDGGHLILDAHCGVIPDAEKLSWALYAVPGVVEHGLFIGLCKTALVATRDNVVEINL